MAFKYRLQIFFVILTILPLLAAGWAISGISGKNRTNRTDQQLAISLSAAEVTYAQDHTAAQTTATQLAMRSDVQDLLGRGGAQNHATLDTLLTQATGSAGFRVAAFDTRNQLIAASIPSNAAFTFKVSVPGEGSMVAAESIPVFFSTLAANSSLPAGEEIVFVRDGRAYPSDGKRSTPVSLGSLSSGRAETSPFSGAASAHSASGWAAPVRSWRSRTSPPSTRRSARSSCARP